MALEDKIAAILEGIQVHRENGRLILYSPDLEEIQKPLVPIRIPIVGMIVDYIIKEFRRPKEERLRSLMAKSLEDHLMEKRDGAKSSEEHTQYDLLLTAFQDFHDIRVNHLPVNHKDVNMPIILIRKFAYTVGFGLMVAQTFIPDFEIPRLIGYPSIIAASVYAIMRTNTQRVDFPLPPLEVIREDIILLSKRYTLAAKKYPRRYSVDQYDSSKIPEMKAHVDQYVQKYCPTMSLSEVNVLVRELRDSCGGRLSIMKNRLKISRSLLDANMEQFYRVYSHEIGHLNGIDSEGFAEYHSLRVLADLAQEEPDGGHDIELYETLLLAAVHSYIIERKRSIRGTGTRWGHWSDVIQYNAHRIVDVVTGKDHHSVLDVGVNKEIYLELVGLGAPADIVGTVFAVYETPSLGNQLFSGIQHLIKKDTFMGGYTKDLYCLARQRGMIQKLSDDGYN